MSAPRWHWYGLDHEPISSYEAEQLLADVDARRVALDVLVLDDGTLAEVSTVFLVLDHQWHPTGPPLLYETAVLTAEHGIVAQRQYSGRAAALASHEQVVARLKAEGLRRH